MDTTGKNSINWYPGHMKKTREGIVKNLKLVDLVIEILDARAPISTKNPDIDNMISNKKKIIVLTKKDLTAEDTLKKFIIKKITIMLYLSMRLIRQKLLL